MFAFKTLRTSILLAFGVLLGVVGCVVLISELMLDQSQSKVLKVHELRMACLVKNTQETPVCASKLMLHPDDFDFCTAAVDRCRNAGVYKAVDSADGVLENWRVRAHILRAILAFCMLAVVGAAAYSLVYARRFSKTT